MDSLFPWDISFTRTTAPTFPTCQRCSFIEQMSGCRHEVSHGSIIAAEAERLPTTQQRRDDALDRPRPSTMKKFHSIHQEPRKRRTHRPKVRCQWFVAHPIKNMKTSFRVWPLSVWTTSLDLRSKLMPGQREPPAAQGSTRHIKTLVDKWF